MAVRQEKARKVKEAQTLTGTEALARSTPWNQVGSAIIGAVSLCSQSDHLLKLYRVSGFRLRLRHAFWDGF